MAQGRFTKIISTTKWIRTNRLSIKNSLSSELSRSLAGGGGGSSRAKRFVFWRGNEPHNERDLCIDNLLVRIHFIIVMIGCTGLAPWEFEFPFPGSLASTSPNYWRKPTDLNCNPDPKPQTLNPKPSTLHPKTHTLRPKC